MNKTKKRNTLNKKKLSKVNFNTKYGNNFAKKYLQHFNGSNVVIMYDLDAPYGKNSSNKNQNKKYIHYLNINGKTLISYAPPTPPQGTHTYVIKKIFMDSGSIEKLKGKLATKNLADRKSIQALSKFSILGVNFESGLKSKKIFYVSK